MTLKDIDKKYVMNTYARFNLEIVSGNKSIVYDENKKEYIDLTSGIGVTSFGICDEEWKNSVIEQLDNIQHMSNLYYTSPCANLAKKLCELTSMNKVFFANSGAEANECAIKVARKYAQDKYSKEKYKILTLENSFHGRTLTTLSATGQDHFHTLFTPLTEGFVYAKANDISNVKSVAKENNVCAIMIECIQGEGGLNVLNYEFVRDLDNFCKENDILLIVDEVQTGNGRTGKLYSYMNYNITPNIITTAKGLGGGLPIGACIVDKKLEDVLTPGDHGSTFGGNPVVCAGALSIVNRLTKEFLDEVTKKGNMVKEKLSKASGISNISGMGLMIGFNTKKDKNEVINECINKGVLVLSAKDKIRLLPALNIDKETLEKAIDIIVEICED